MNIICIRTEILTFGQRNISIVSVLRRSDDSDVPVLLSFFIGFFGKLTRYNIVGFSGTGEKIVAN